MKIQVTAKGYRLPQDVQVTVYEDGFIDYCSHTNQEIEFVTFNDGTDYEYGWSLAVCQKCGAGWNEDGEEVLESCL